MSSLSVLHISTTDNLGGSAKSAYKIHRVLRELGVTSRMLVRLKVTDDHDVGVIHRGVWKLLDQIGRFGFDPMGLESLFYPSTFALVRHPWFREADVVQLYNTHGHYFTHTALPLLSKGKKIVWRLSDMWPLTGHCFYSYDCDRWKTGCGRCPRLEEYPSLNFDTSAILWRIKKWSYRRCNIHLVATNSWMAGIIKESSLLNEFESSIIPNGVDEAVYRPLSKMKARELLCIESNKPVVLFSAHEAIPGTRKGGEFVIPVMEKVARSDFENLVLIVLGEKAESWREGDGYETIRLEFTQSDRLLSIVYSAADVLLCPSVAENFPNNAVESSACSTPIIGFNTGGMSDVIRHMETGYLARYKDTADLANGLRLLLKDEALRLKMGNRCREIVENEYSLGLQAKRFKELYERILHDKGKLKSF